MGGVFLRRLTKMENNKPNNNKNKNKPLDKRGKIRLFSFVGAAIIALGAFGISENVKRRDYERLIAASQQRALSELGTYIDNIEVSLKKGKYANSAPMVSSLASSLWRDSTGAKTSLAQLGTGETPLENTYKFLSQVGEFTMALNRKVADGGKISEEEKSRLDKLYDYAKGLNEEISYMEDMVQNDNLNFEKIKSTLNIAKEQENEPANFIDSMDNAEQALTDYPTLLYDGPFADNIDQKESKMLKAASEISQEDAKKKAAAYADVEIDSLNDMGQEDGKMPSYLFAGKDFTICISKNGGYLNYMLGSSYAGEIALKPEDAIKKATEYLDKHGYGNMRESYYSTSDGVCTINFAHTENEIIYYPDLIKVSVALDDGRIVSVDARGYLMNHQERDVQVPQMTLKGGVGNLASGLDVMDAQYAVIPKDNGDEQFVYEYHCKDSTGQEVLVYINPESGDEAEIMLLMYSDGGILTK